MQLLYNFIEITLRQRCSPENLRHIFRIFLKERLWRAASEHNRHNRKII